MNNMNPMAMMKIAALIEKFKSNHPKVFPFFSEVGRRVGEGSIIEIKVTDPNGESLTCNMKVLADDLEMVETFKQMGVNQ